MTGKNKWPRTQKSGAMARQERLTDLPRNRESITRGRSSQQCFLVALRVCDLIDDQANTTLRDDVRHAVTDLDANHGLGCGDAEHGEKIHHWVGAPTHNGR